MSQDFYDMLKLLLGKRAESGAHKFMQADPEYNNMVKHACDLENDYNKLPLKDGERAKIDSLLEARMDVENRHLTFAYMAGAEDCFNYLVKMGMVSEFPDDFKY